MVNKKFCLGILVMALVLGMAVIGCNNDTDNGNGSGNTSGGSSGGGGGSTSGGGGKTDPALNGTWILVSQIIHGIENTFTDIYESKYNNGSYEYSQQTNNFSGLRERGNYSTNGNILNYSNRQYNGAYYVLAYASIPGNLGFQSKWYSQDELDSIMKSNMPDYFRYEGTTTYSISGNTLTITSDGYISSGGPISPTQFIAKYTRK